jgi:hypothetical protein
MYGSLRSGVVGWCGIVCEIISFMDVHSLEICNSSGRTQGPEVLDGSAKIASVMISTTSYAELALIGILVNAMATQVHYLINHSLH